MNWKSDKSKFKDVGGRYITQSLFLEFGYNTDLAVFTLDGYDKEYKGKKYPSLKRLYLEAEDTHEYTFATTYLFDWEHWKRLITNKAVRKHIDEWREELEIKLASTGVQKILDLAEDGNFQAAKFVADRQWNKKRGRPSKAEQEKSDRIQERIDNEFQEDLDRLGEVVPLNANT